MSVEKIFLFFLINLSILNLSFSLEPELTAPYEKTIPYCDVEDPESKTCTLCKMGYGLTREKKCSICSVKYCMSCLTNYTLCDDCDQFFYKDNKGQCVQPEDKNCRYPTGTKCSRCDFGFFINETGICEKGKIELCETYNSRNKCFICKDGYGVKNEEGKEINKCEKCEEGCSVCGQNYQKCQTCLSGYYLNDDKKCKKCIDGCNICTNSTNCEECNYGYYKKKDKICQKGCDDDHCKSCKGSGTGKCIVCELGYGLNTDGECKKLQDNCVKENEDGDCQVCGEDYYVGYSDDFKKKICKPIMSGCQKAYYRDNWDICLGCKEGYTLRGDFKKCTKDQKDDDKGNKSCFIKGMNLIMGSLLMLLL